MTRPSSRSRLSFADRSDSGVRSCRRPWPGPGPDEDRLKATGAEALKPFKQQLMSALVKGLKEGPGIGDPEVCKDQAPKIAAEAGADSITIGRTSHRLRNRANAPEPWMEPLLEKYAATRK